MPAYYLRSAFESHNKTTGALVTNVLHIEADTLTSPPNYTSIAADVGTRWASQYLAILGTDDHFDQIVVTQEEQTGVSPGQGVSVINQDGLRTLADSKLSPGICALTSWKTQTPKRYGRGHTFWPPATTQVAAMAEGKLDPANAYMTAIANFVTAWVGGWAAGSTSYKPIIYSRSQFRQNLQPYVFPIVAGTTGTSQHFLRSRTNTP